MSYKFFKTIDPKLYDLNVYYDPNLYNSATNFGSLLIQTSDILDDFIQLHKSRVSFDPVELQAQLFATLDSSTLDKYNEAQFKIFWFEKYLTAITPVKERFASITNGVINIFKDVSDSIGCLRNVDYLPDDSILAVFDIDFNLASDELVSQLIPINYATTIQNKLSVNSKILTSYMSRFCTSTFRHNMYQLALPAADNMQAHGSNLVVDYQHYNRIYNIAKEELESQLTKFYGELYDIITFYENYQYQDVETDNLQFKEKGAISWTIEGIEKATDYLKQEVGFFKNIAKSTDILGVQD